MARLNDSDLKGIISKPGYGIASSGAGIKGTLRAGIALHQAGGAGSLNDLESAPSDESLGSKKLQVGCTGRIEIRITFYRRRLADYGEECSRAISEKALIDSLVYAGLIQGDSGSEVRITDGGQKKVGTDEEERTELEIFYPEVDFGSLWVKAKEHKGH